MRAFFRALCSAVCVWTHLLVVEEGDARLEELVEIKGVVRQELHAARLAHEASVDAAKLAREHVEVEGRGQPRLRFLLPHERADAHLDDHEPGRVAAVCVRVIRVGNSESRHMPSEAWWTRERGVMVRATCKRAFLLHT